MRAASVWPVLPAILFLLPATLGAPPPSLTTDSGDLYLQSDGGMAAEPGGSAATCLALTDAGAATTAKSFATELSADPTFPDESTITLDLAVSPDTRAGTGFRIDADLTFGNGTSVHASKAFSQGASVDSPITLALPIRSADLKNGTGALVLDVALSKTGAGGVASVGHNVQVVCGSSDTRLHSFRYARGAIDDVDADADGIPDSIDPEVPSADDANGIHPLTGLERLGVSAIAVGAGIVTLLAGLLVLAGRGISERRAHLLLGGTAGLLLAVAIVDLVPEAIEASESSGWIIALALLGLVAIRWVTGEAGHGHGHGGHHDDEAHEVHQHPEHEEHHPAGHRGELRGTQLAVIAFLALLVHRIVDGLSLPGAFAAGGEVGLAAGSAILIHQFPDGLAAASIFVGSGYPRRVSLRNVGILSFATPVGAFVGLFFASFAGVLPVMLAIAAATFIFISLSELLPELRKPEFRWVVAIGFVIGYALTYVIEVAAGWAGIAV